MSNQVKLGKLGENLVAQLMGATLVDDPYDSVKDLLMPNGETIEVKTQNRHPTKPLLTISAVNSGNGLTNVMKCLTVDHLIFVEYDYSDIIKVWRMRWKNRRYYHMYTTRQGKQMIGFEISKMNLIAEHEDKKLAEQMRNLSQSFVFK